MKEKHVRQLLQEQINIYLNNIAIDLESSHDRWFEDFGFPMFGTTAKEYHEQVYFQSYLESYTRKLINSVLAEICYEDSAAKISWPEVEYTGIYNGYTNSEYERDFVFEFIDCDKRTGYRYTSIDLDNIESVFSKGKVDRVKIVVWKNEDDPAGFCYDDSRISVIHLWELFQELFCDLDESEIRTMYDLFISNISKAVAKASSMISLTTLPGFTPTYLAKVRPVILSALRAEVAELSSYSIMNPRYEKKDEVESNSVKLITCYNLHSTFLAKKFEHAFVGVRPFAKSFLTSEYLYRHFRKNPMFDFTPIVSGYIKSIEQLLNTLCENYRNTKNEYLDMHDYTMGNYTAYVDGNVEMFREEFHAVKKTLIDCLNSYRIECRNHLFHRDYFDSWDRVEVIRRNTIFLYVALMGMIDTDKISRNQNIFGILRDDYDRLFRIIERQKDRRYSIRLDGKEYSSLDIERRTTGIHFDKYGLIDTPIKFRKFGYDQYEIIEISNRHMPAEIWTTDIYGKSVTKIWPQDS